VDWQRGTRETGEKKRAESEWHGARDEWRRERRKEKNGSKKKNNLSAVVTAIVHGGEGRSGLSVIAEEALES
jgi:hypothetical protein